MIQQFDWLAGAIEQEQVTGERGFLEQRTVISTVFLSFCLFVYVYLYVCVCVCMCVCVCVYSVCVCIVCVCVYIVLNSNMLAVLKHAFRHHSVTYCIMVACR